MKKTNFLLGKAERLVKRIDPPKIKPEKAHPYSFEIAQRRIAPKLATLVKDVGQIPAAACPNDEVVALVSLNPAYLAKSYFPDTILSEANLRSVGSRQRVLTPDAVTGKKERKETPTAELFIAGKRQDFKRIATAVPTWTELSRGAEDLRKIEDVRSFLAAEKIRRSTRKTKTAPLWEVVLHASGLNESDYILDGFREYMKSLDIKVDLDKRLHAQGLCFLPVKIPRESIADVAKFSFLRVAREMPKMRLMRTSKSNPDFVVELPDVDVVDPTIQVAVFDGGLPAAPDLTRWTNRKKANGVAKTGHPELLAHGLGVTSAILFGPLEEGIDPGRPYAKVDHFRVIDEESLDESKDEHREYFDVIKRIMTILENGNYEFVNLSIGPDLPIDDNEVHVWTAMLDQYLKKATTFAGIAVGNEGEADPSSGNSRIQTPADCVNGMSFGSATCMGDGWKRSPHSCIGRGRSPGVVKPDALCFGGSAKNPFYVLSQSGRAVGKIGTSFATPLGVRSALGVRAILGPVMSPLAIKALLIHRCENEADHPLVEVGWGRIPDSIGDLITCDDASAYIVYRGELGPGSYMRAQIPVPDDEMAGKVQIRATICFATDTDPQDSLNYTRSGLEVTFRPHEDKKKDPKQAHADSKSFFSAKNLYANELELRDEAHMWETSLHARKPFYGSSLKNPVFDIHYNARTGGGKAKSPQNVAYAMIVSVHAPRVLDLYDRIVRRYRTTLEAFQPVVEVTIRH